MEFGRPAIKRAGANAKLGRMVDSLCVGDFSEASEHVTPDSSRSRSGSALFARSSCTNCKWPCWTLVGQVGRIKDVLRALGDVPTAVKKCEGAMTA